MSWSGSAPTTGRWNSLKSDTVPPQPESASAAMRAERPFVVSWRLAVAQQCPDPVEGPFGEIGWSDPQLEMAFVCEPLV